MKASYEKYEQKYLKNYPERMIKSKTKSKEHKKIEKSPGKKHHKTKKKITEYDKKAYMEVHKRLLYLIDRRVVIFKKPNGKTMDIAGYRDDEEYKMWQLRETLEAIQARDETHAFFIGEEYKVPSYLAKPDLILERYQEEYPKEKGKKIINKSPKFLEIKLVKKRKRTGGPRVRIIDPFIPRKKS